MKCEYGCGNDAKYQMTSGKWCCEKFYTQCPANKKKNSDQIKDAHKEGRVIGWSDLWKSKKVKSWNKGKNIFSDSRLSKKTPKDIFKKDSDVHRQYAKRLIIQEKLIEYKCRDCDLIDEWNGKKLILELEHINGDKKDYRLKNLTFLCPNCHSQTPTFRNRK